MKWSESEASIGRVLAIEVSVHSRICIYYDISLDPLYCTGACLPYFLDFIPEYVILNLEIGFACICNRRGSLL